MCLSHFLDPFFDFDLFDVAPICHHCVTTIEDDRNLLKRRPTSLGKQEEDAQAFDDENDNVHKVELPLQCLKTDGVYVSRARSAL